ncbi:MAG: tripartite tricarboxylate transporter substrate binding protein, partial [Phenylobacterium sp.]|uniref:Bug family tripartite tricarboxylate transporter substrate binding protein n=1 Tax=Phenylobacterium sp. TaxID=1871053 RepID=UPI002734E180
MIRANLNSWCKAVAASAAILLGTCANAEFPDKPLNLIVGFSAGGGVDVVGRTIAQGLSVQLKTSVVVDNKTGASGAIAAQHVKRAAPDGYTLLMAPTTSYVMTEKMVGPEVTGYEMAKDFSPVATVGELPLVMLSSKSSAIASYADVTALARKNPGKLAYGSSGNGSTEHIVTEWFRQQSTLELLHVPYRGSAPAIADLFADQIQILVTTSPTALTNLATGRVTAVGVASAQRLSVMPDVPTFAEQGLPQFIAASVYSVLAPKGTPDAVITTLNTALNQALSDEATQRRFAQLGVQVVRSTPLQAR